MRTQDGFLYINLPQTLIDHAGRVTEYAYDERGNLISITDPAGNTTRYGYNAESLPETITDATGKSKTLSYDALGQLVGYTDCSGQTTRFGYTGYGELETVTDALGHTTRHHYDAAGNHIRTEWHPPATPSAFSFPSPPRRRRCLPVRPIRPNL